MKLWVGFPTTSTYPSSSVKTIVVTSRRGGRGRGRRGKRRKKEEKEEEIEEEE